MKTLKQLFRAEGFEVNRDDQKGLGNKAIDDQREVYLRWLTQKRQKNCCVTGNFNMFLDELLEELESE